MWNSLWRLQGKIANIKSIFFRTAIFCYAFTGSLMVIDTKFSVWTLKIVIDAVGNKAKGRISKQVFQESKACQNFRKTNISYLLIRTRACAYQGVRNVCF